MNYAIVDIETTGGSTKSSKITEIAIYKHDGMKIIDSFDTLVNPEMPIPEFISRLTGIHDDMVENAPKFYEIAKQIIEFTEDCIFVAHNVGFDYGIIRHEFKLLGYDYRKAHLCTVRASRYVIPDHESYSLGKLTKALGIQLIGRHRAKGDAEATAHLFTLLHTTDSKGLQTFIQEEINPKILHPNLDLETLEEIPNKPGIYKFYNDTNQLIYIGKSKHIKKRIEQHLKNVKTLKGSIMREEIARIEFELTGSELIALLYESELIKIHKPIYNRALRRNNYSYGLFSFEDQAGFIQLYVDKINKTSNLPITTFTTKKEANDYIFQLVDEFQLCQKLVGLEKSSGSCFGYQIKKCHGACVGAETSESYNLRIQALINQLTFDDDNLFLVENGRDKREKSVVWIENGSYRGFGFVPYFALKQPHRNWLRFIDMHPEDKDARTILRYYTRKNVELLKIPYNG
ncbi:3'-5' exonuclease family protein [Fluviicola taffensis]|uniref:Excinuclease cho n=1 Tax=Fluviicola taffensis (strain DSM 16823 / NCIMB 13979 / RW262) TaxID=755732 RepID=F2IIN4_FLUTR|nr:exonuclease domain-containing protein [Fluviicola taffensis]AEA45996.1 DNA polymerase III, epsilon subunit [Fluviicola taffensis DSM 16823]